MGWKTWGVTGKVWKWKVGELAVVVIVAVFGFWGGCGLWDRRLVCV